MKDFRPYVGRQVRVFTEFATIAGTLERAGDAAMTLTHAAVIADSGGQSPLDGDVIVPAAQVQWVQVP